MICLPYENRSIAGQALAKALKSRHPWTNPLVLALPRGGVPVAVEVANVLGAELDLMMVRKLGMPGHSECAMGAVASGGICLKNRAAIELSDVSPEEFEAERVKEEARLHRRDSLYRSNRPFPSVRGRSVLLIDDGMATGTTMKAAVRATARLHPLEIAVAVPVASRSAVASIERTADEVLCPAIPEPFLSVGIFYTDFSQLTDEEVCHSLNKTWAQHKERMSAAIAPHEVND